MVAILGFNNLNQSAAVQIQKGINQANHEYLQKYIDSTADRTNLLLNKEIDDSQMLADYIQNLEDNKATFGSLFDAAGGLAFVNDALKQDPATGAYQNDSNSPSVVTLFPSALGPDGKPTAATLANIHQTALLDLLLPLVKKYSPQKNRILYVGPVDAPYRRAIPWSNYASDFAKAFQDYRTRSLLDYEPRLSLRNNWERWVKDPSTKADLTNEVTLTQPFIDAFIKESVIVVSHPIWDSTRTQIRGEVAFDWKLSQVNQLIQDVQIANTGFAFLAQSDGNVIAINDAGSKIMGLQSQTTTSLGLQLALRQLQNSQQKGIASLQMPIDENPVFSIININNEPYQVVLERLSPLNFLSADGSAIHPNSWTIGFVVPQSELLATLRNTQNDVNNNAQGILTFQLIVSLGALIVAIIAVSVVSNRMTSSLKELAIAAGKLRQKDYGVRVNVKSKDEVGAVGNAFNGMASEISSYTQHLEDAVAERTFELKDANDEIVKLNNRLRSENSRLKAEVEVTREIQQKILPNDDELVHIDGLDIAGYMQPADEVGGDYYDVLQENGHVKIGIGDVTGHGLESGMLMLMVQTAIRTLLVNQEADPVRFLNVLNQTIYGNVQRMHSDKNLTLALLDYKQGNLHLTGQHEETIIVRSTGELEVIDTIDLGFPVGLEENIAAFVAERDIPLAKGDIVVLYSDGITEAENLQNEQYGLNRLCEAVRINRDCVACEIQQAVIDDLQDFIGEQKIFDDITLVVLKQK
jgi:sigma-B regulation protein RsbU (phosphoserine phosphatase)